MESMALRAVLLFRLQFFIYSELEYISPAGRVLYQKDKEGGENKKR